MTNALSHSFIYILLRSKTCSEKYLFLDSHFHYRKVSFLSILQHKSHKFKSTVSKTMNIMHSDFTMHPHSKMLSTDADKEYYTYSNGPDCRVLERSSRRKKDNFILSDHNLSKLIHW